MKYKILGLAALAVMPLRHLWSRRPRRKPGFTST